MQVSLNSELEVPKQVTNSSQSDTSFRMSTKKLGNLRFSDDYSISYCISLLISIMIFLQGRNLYNPHALHGVHGKATRSVLWMLRQDKRLLTSMEWNLRLKLVTYNSM